MKEKWKWIKGYKGFYKISNKGRVKSVKRKVVYEDGRVFTYKEQLRKINFDTVGYPMTCLYKNTKRKGIRIHRLVSRAFIGKCPKGAEVMHLDGVKTNNSIKNLRYGSRSCNAAFKVDHGTLVFGEDSPSSKLTEKDVIKMRDLRNRLNYEYKKIAKMYGVKPSTAREAVVGITWKHLK